VNVKHNEVKDFFFIEPQLSKDETDGYACAVEG